MEVPPNGVTVVVAAYFRRDNLRRCLAALTRQTLPPAQIIVADDSDNAWLADEAKPPVEYVQVRPMGQPRCQNIAVLTVWPKIRGDYVILCSSDILAPSFAVESMVTQHSGTGRSAVTVYGLDQDTTESLDTIDWIGTDCALFATLPGFWAWRTPGTMMNVEAHKWATEILFTGNTKEAWEAFGGPLPRTTLGFMDELGIHEIETRNRRSSRQIDLAVYHQWHDSVWVLTGLEKARRAEITSLTGEPPPSEDRGGSR